MTFTRRRILTRRRGRLRAARCWRQGQPVRIGSTLALTGPLSATALTHKLVGEIYVEQLNKRGGLLAAQGRMDREGRPVQAGPRRARSTSSW
jgi:branched-chain amino acid transport system substrate-binding protein